MQVVLAGASGLIGAALADSLRAEGHRVKRLVRRRESGADVDSWDPSAGLLDPDFLRGADAIVCLSGAGVGERRWTAAYKRTLVASRVDTVGTVARTLAEYDPGPQVLVCASAVGYYGDTGDRVTDESAPGGDTFLAQLCAQWEAAADSARAAGIRVTHLRSGLVLAPGGGLLGRLVPIVRAGIGGPLGSGRQYMPWVALADELAAIRFLLDHDDVAGPVNVVAPSPVTNAEFTRTLGRVLHRPTVFRVPGFAARIALGEFATEVLIGQRAVPARLTEAGFRFTHSDLEAALREQLTH